jgi:murein DD-endopeptidase MepM/ murein hydrolase activator NlpD
MNKVRCIKPFGGSFPISSPFGERIDPKSGVKKMHNGIDFACPENTPIRAVLDGRILVDGWENENDHSHGYGRRIWQECNINGTTVLIVYAHLNQINKSQGEFISQSGILGLSGNTGKSTGPHLHLGARIKNTNHFLDFDFEDYVPSPFHDFEESKPEKDSYVKT